MEFTAAAPVYERRSLSRKTGGCASGGCYNRVNAGTAPACAFVNFNRQAGRLRYG
jgi:hypothetical protein